MERPLLLSPASSRAVTHEYGLAPSRLTWGFEGCCGEQATSAPLPDPATCITQRCFRPPGVVSRADPIAQPVHDAEATRCAKKHMIHLPPFAQFRSRSCTHLVHARRILQEDHQAEIDRFNKDPFLTLMIALSRIQVLGQMCLL